MYGSILFSTQISRIDWETISLGYPRSEIRDGGLNRQRAGKKITLSRVLYSANRTMRSASFEPHIIINGGVLSPQVFALASTSFRSVIPCYMSLQLSHLSCFVFLFPFFPFF